MSRNSRSGTVAAVGAGFLGAILFLRGERVARAAAIAGSVATSDGLALSLSPSGAVEALRDAGSNLASASVPSGFAFRELPAVPTDLAPNGSFEKGTPAASWSWSNDANGVWELVSEGADSLRALRLMMAGGVLRRSPMVLSSKFPILPSTAYTVSFQTKASDLMGGLTVYVVEEETGGKASQRSVGSVSGTSGWTTRSTSYTSGANAARAYFKIEVYRGSGTVWVDDVRMLDHFGARPPAAFGGTVSFRAGGLKQTATVSGLKLEARFQGRGNAIRVDAVLTDESDEDRAVELSFGLPIEAEGWIWEESFVSRSTIAKGARYENLSPGYGPRGYSVYPFAAVTSKSTSISLAVPPTPQIARLTYDVDSGFRVTWDLGFSPAAKKTPSKASMTFWIYRQLPKWSYRAAAERYYALNSESFTSKFAPLGSWVLTGTAEALAKVPNWRDFGWGWIEGVGNIRFGTDNALVSHHYLGPFGWFRAIPGYPAPSPPPPYEVIVAFLEEWARSGTGTTTDGAPVREMAQAVVNSSPYDERGRYQVKANSYFWYGQRLQVYPVSADPDIPPPSMWTLMRAYGVGDRLARTQSKGSLLGGFFLDDLGHHFSGVENHRKELWAYSDYPLAFSLTAQRVVLYNGFSMAECAKALHEYVNTIGMSLAGSMGPSSYVWFAPHVDIVGGEVPGAEPPDRAYLRRALGYGKALTNLLVQPRGAGPPDREQVLAYLRQGLLLGYFPGFSESYWREASAYERDRPLFKTYMPLILKTVEAGWRPVNYVKASTPAVFVERFGDGSDGVLYFTAQNTGASPEKVEFWVDRQALGLGSEGLELAELVSGAAVPFSIKGEGIEFSFTLGHSETAVYRLTFPRARSPRRLPDRPTPTSSR